MSVWKQTIARQLRTLHLDSMRGKLLVFAVLGTLIPSLATTFASYARNQRLLNERITQDLGNLSSEAAREAEEASGEAAGATTL